MIRVACDRILPRARARLNQTTKLPERLSYFRRAGSLSRRARAKMSRGECNRTFSRRIARPAAGPAANG